MSDWPGTHPHFRLNLEQQQKRAKDLLRVARAGEASALTKFRSHPPKLAEAQYLDRARAVPRTGRVDILRGAFAACG